MKDAYVFELLEFRKTATFPLASSEKMSDKEGIFKSVQKFSSAIKDIVSATVALESTLHTFVTKRVMSTFPSRLKRAYNTPSAPFMGTVLKPLRKSTHTNIYGGHEMPVLSSNIRYAVK